MKILWWGILFISMTTNCIGIDVEKTVSQVENILKQNSQLPRLSRDEIIQLLNDIRAEDAKSKSSQSSSKSQETQSTSNSLEQDSENEINGATKFSDIAENEVNDEKVDTFTEASSPKQTIQEVTTKRNEPTLMVVLPYTPRDGSSLQDLYTRPPRIEIVSITEPTVSEKSKQKSKIQKHPKAVDLNSVDKNLLETLGKNAKQANKHQENIPVPKDLQEFLDKHGLDKMPDAADHFLLPLEGFKPLPPLKPIDGSVELPENILLTYDLMPSNTDNKNELNSNNNFLYEPLRPELPFELDTSSSELQKTVLPLELPKSRKPKAVEGPQFQPIDYDSVKVIPLQKGANPVVDESERVDLENEQRKRQTNSSDEALKISFSISTNGTSSNENTNQTELPSSSTTEESTKAASTTTVAPSAPNDSVGADSGASITDLEDSFGGPLPSQPGDSQLPPPRKNGFYWMLDWNSFLEVGDGDTKVNIRFEPKLGDPQMFLPVNVP